MLTANNPFTGEKIAEYESLDAEQVSARIGQASEAFATWRHTSFAERAKVLTAVAAELRKRKSTIAQYMADEMGKPVREGEPEVEKAAWCAEYYAEHAEEYLTSESLPSDASHSYVCYQPLGTLLGILPWNAPLWLAFRYLAPALMAGNTCVMKHDPNVPASAQSIADAFVAAGAPENIMVNLPVETSLVEKAIRDPRIAAVSFTGSAGAGSKVAAVAGSEIKPCVLELGGSDPCIVLADADLEAAADVAVLSRIINAGQSCIAAKRILVEESAMDKFVPMLKSRLQALKMGDPKDEQTQVGPIARRDLQLNLHRQVSETVEAGAKCLLGGELPDSAGYFYPVTLLTEVTAQMTAFREETFGPVMAVTSVSGIEEAIELANDSDYGLGAAIWTADVKQAEQWAQQIDAGQVAINGIVKTDPRLPSGGIKRSGFGRELGPHGIKEFVNAKQIWVK
ncbi:NAD-dependent succinate-semialdehyde dehydrogenase [Gilvimarinus agarilyticus]|uniref:NAD-dependent succinate-semialdehyde dehydrogenase n=1 Tax=Gilvimarinus sp. 2_MG-2023 TaxID=3062666 RepID=UPI001C0A0E02|nr:NAD-dependent succinate-semialdehyde dehydrogenase [Gilvimarinus sp. 2_MG-2023]MBU2886579.1 NAD-dependent succinate-semialdehyde dehydrogenase [Gilvimarinus agarilyticus]MDO6571247.1 NAD-dependent succinate-semialdehyde dehydrogenase [Gilvimarinus sp. 2_MG-2023]